MIFSCVPLSVYATEEHDHNYVTETNEEKGVQTIYCKDNGETTFVYDTSTQYPESPHNYDNYMDQQYSYSIPGAQSYLVKFSDKCQTEAKYDTITISDGLDKIVGVYSGTELAGKTLFIEGSYFNIVFKTDRSKVFYGFSIDTITVNEEDSSYVVPNIWWESEKINPNLTGYLPYPETLSHEFQDNYADFKESIYSEDRYQGYRVDGAIAYTVRFSKELANNSDLYSIDIYHDPNTVERYRAKDLAGKTLKINEPSFAIEAYNEHDGIDSHPRSEGYGYSIDSIVAYFPNGSKYNTYEMPKEGDLSKVVANYANNLDETREIYIPGATEINLTFETIGFEKGYDYLAIYDENGKMVKKYSDTNIKDDELKVHLNGNKYSFKIHSDGSNMKNYSGFKLKSVTGKKNASIVNPSGDYELLLPSADYPQSKHNYDNYSTLYYGYSYPNAKSLKVKFSNKCKTEANYDIVSIFDENNNKIGSYSGDQLAGKTVDIPTGSFRIYFSTDRSKTYYGFSIDSIVATMSSNPEFVNSKYSRTYYTPIIPYSPHNYYNNANETYYYTDATASSIDILFSSQTLTEANYDFITVYDKNGKQIARYSGKQATGKSVHINGNSFSIKFTSDRSKVYYGYSLAYVSPNYDNPHEGSNVYAYPETSHKYQNYAKQTYKYVSPYSDAKALDLKFSNQTYTEANYDFITIYDGNGKFVGKYSGSQLAGKTIRVNGNNFKIDFTTDRSACYYGFSFDTITSIFDTDYYEQIELKHNYVQTQTIKENGVVHKVYACTNCGNIQKDVNFTIENLNIDLNESEFAFDGKEHKPLPVFESSNLKLTEGVDYTVTYDEDCISVGKHKVIINFINGYNSMRELNYVIYPSSIPKFTIKNTGFAFDITFADKGSYRIVYADNKEFNNAKSINIHSDSFSVTEVEVGKTYYVKAYSYLMQNGKMYCSEVSETQAVYVDGIMSEISDLVLTTVDVKDMPWAVKATWDAVPNADEYEVFVRCWDYDVVKDERHYNLTDVAYRKVYKDADWSFDNGYASESSFWTPLANKEIYMYPANYNTENIEIGNINTGGRIVEHRNAHKGVVRPFYTDEQIIDEIEKGDFLNHPYPGKVSVPKISSKDGYYSYDNYYYRYYTENNGSIDLSVSSIASSGEALPACGIKYVTTNTEFTTYANLADYHRYTISVRAIKKGDVNYNSPWNTQLIKLGKKEYSSYSDKNIITDTEKKYVESELLKAEKYVKQLWNKNIKFNFFDVTEVLKEDLYLQNAFRLNHPCASVQSYNTGNAMVEGNRRYWNSVTSNKLNENYDYNVAITDDLIGMKTNLWGDYGFLRGRFDFLDFDSTDIYYGEYDVFYAWQEIEGSIQLKIRIVGRNSWYDGKPRDCDYADPAIRSALDLPACKNNCHMCQQVYLADSRI